MFIGTQAGRSPPGYIPGIIHGVKYEPYSAHRDGTRRKSQWTITVRDEIRSFTAAEGDGWLDTTRGWGLHRPNRSPEYLGVAVDRDRQLFIAKFVRGRAGEPWHGYPADPQLKPQDLPAERVRRAWLDQEILPAVLIRRLIKGQPCAL
jgi:hypothetical protein